MIAVVLLTIFGGNSISYEAGKAMNYAAERGYGIFQKLHYTDRVNNPSKNISNPFLSGTELIYSWAELEPEEGRFRWDLIDLPLNLWAEHGKRVILSFRTVQKRGKSPTQKSATPVWVYKSGARKIEIDGTNWPIYWDSNYLKKYDNFIKAVAERYDGNPGIEFVIMGIGQFGTTKIAGDGRAFKEYKRSGYTENLWSSTIKDIIEIHKKHFKKTPIALMPSPFHRYGDNSEIFIHPLAEYAAQRGVYLYNHSLTGKPYFANNPFLPIYEKVHNMTKIALGPDGPVKRGGRKNLSTDDNDDIIEDASQSELKKAKKEGRLNRSRYVKKLQEKGQHKEKGSIEDVIKNAFGGVNDIPLTYVSYLIFYSQDISAATSGNNMFDGRFESAMKEAHRRLTAENLKNKYGR